ncbi:lipase/esterase [Streptomyces lincolnensis]|uniref:Lipase/esterase n=1 Tax=Streptomyces lincolnensis TaxID=1915 RepID=A0A1B1MIW5_STRLN|nr:alpha/beta hydrolase [Streptomyces lincolnensis]ANS68539.1 lipase/esterase [Streptomyces lincolnensis]AXG53255.1 lipase/esterase [Streptomyces lincolnensis]QMV10162.1 alpha/beta hydrolase fold domain-containing protein [Streptomyces lincolnensis]
MAYAIDPELAPWAELLPGMPFRDVAEARAVESRILDAMPEGETAVPVEVRQSTAAGPQGAGRVPVRVYTPRGADGPRAALVYLHGGGFCLGSVELSHGGCAVFAAETGAVVVSVEYRLAPEHPFPAGLEDAYAAFVWTVEHAAGLGVDAARVGVGGDSAGGGLAAALSLLARDRGGPAPCFQYLGNPALDDRLGTPSMRAFTDTPGLRRGDVEAIWDHYLGGPGRRGGEGVSPCAAPARAEDLAGLPPAYVSVCEFDPLRDEGLDYAHRLVRAGVPTELHLFPGTFHASAAVQDAEVSRRMIGEAIGAMRRGLRAGAGR